MDLELQIIIAIVTFSLMLCVGLLSSLNEIKKNIFVFDKDFKVAVLSQMILVPLITYICITFFFDIDLEFKIFLMLIALAPGAVISTAYVNLSGGNTVLSLKLSFYLTILSAFTLPILFKIYNDSIIDGVNVDIIKAILKISILVILPIFIGAKIKQKFSNLNNRLIKLIAVIILLFSSVITFQIFNKDLTMEYFNKIPYMLILIIFFILSAALLGVIFKLKKENRITLIIETFMQNQAVVLTIGSITMPGYTLVVSSLLWMTIQFVFGYIFIFMNYKK